MAKNKKRRRNRNDPRRKEIQRQREEARRRVAEQRRKEREAEEQRARRFALLRRFGLPVLAGLGVFTIALVLFRPAPELPGVQRPPLQEPVELAAGASGEYDSATPTSGAYLPGDPICGAFEDEISPEQAVTALYHGAVVLWHRPGLPESELAELAGFVDEFPATLVVSPNDAVAGPIVATAWGRLRAYDGADADVREFVQIYRDRGPGEATCPTG